MRAWIPLLLAAIACAASPLAAQGAPPALLRVAESPGGVTLALDSATIIRTGDSTFHLTAVYQFPREAARRYGADRRLESQEMDCAGNRVRGQVVGLFNGDVPLQPAGLDTAGLGVWKPVAQAELPLHRAICDRLLGSFATALPLSYPVEDVERRPELANRDEVRRRILREMPAVLREAGSAGTVFVRMQIGADGSVNPASVRVLSAPFRTIGDAATRMVRQMRFRPATLHGQPVPVWVTLPLRFSLTA